MPLNLRFDLRVRRAKTLAKRLDAAWELLDRIKVNEVKPGWWAPFHASRMKRSFVRHRSVYRYKARLHYALGYLGLGDLDWIGLGLAVIGAIFIRPVRKPENHEAMDRYDAYLLRCEVEDIMDEIRRRAAKQTTRSTG